MKHIYAPLACAVFFFCCKPASEAPASAPAIAPLQDSRLNETSGIATSVTHPGLLYVHNDSGDTSRFFAITPDGLLSAIIYFNGDPHLPHLGVIDCEDITVSTGPEKGVSYVYLGDIGDNGAARKYITVYRIKEPALPATGQSVNVKAEALCLKYPDGARDAETLMADPIDQLLYIVSKREDTVRVYTTPLNFNTGDTVTLLKKAGIFFPGSGELKWITAGDISQDGKQVLLKSYTQVYYWKRAAGEAIWQTLQHAPASLPYTIEPQGEAIGFTTDGKGYYTVSEGVHANLYHYTLPGH